MYPIFVAAQTGRGFVSVEGYVGLSKEVQVGKIEKFELIEYNKPLKAPESYGKPYRVSFAVSETIRGEKTKSVEIVLAVQIPGSLQYFKDHHTELMLVVSDDALDSVPMPEVGIEENGKRVDGTWYQFRILNPIAVPDEVQQTWIEQQLGTSYDHGRMFDLDLAVVSGREQILKRARRFAKDHKEKCRSVWLRVPNSFGSLCGYPNAFCGISLPRTVKTERLLVSLLEKPDQILDCMPIKGTDLERYGLLYNVLRSLESFPSKENAAQIRKLLKALPSGKEEPEERYGSPQLVHAMGTALLKRWAI